MPANSSLLQDSTFSSSSHECDSNAVKRAPVTYSRKRHLNAEGDKNAEPYSTTNGVNKTSYTSRFIQRANSAGPFHVSSEPECADDEKDDDDDQRDAPSVIFGWKKRLREMDDEDDFDLTTFSGFNDNHDSLMEQQNAESPFKAPGAGLEIDNAGLKELKGVLNKSKALQEQSTNDDASGRRSPFPSLTKSRVSNPSTPDIGLARRRTRGRVVHDSDSDSEPSRDKKLGSSGVKTSSPLIFLTPNSQSSPTPPTSDDEMSLGFTSKGKGKASAVPRTSVPPLQFSVEPLSGTDSEQIESTLTDKRRTVSRVKAPTKKEIRESAKNRGRLAADQCVSLPKAESNRKFTIQTLLTTITQNQKEAKQSSDPIIPFSSSPSWQEAGPPADQQSADSVSSSEGKTLEFEAVPIEKENKMKELLATKQRALALQSARTKREEDEEDDLEIIPGSDLASKGMHISGDGKRRLPNRGARLTKRALAGSPVSLEPKRSTHKAENKYKGVSNQAELSRSLAERVKEQNRQLTKQKEEEWVRSGGRLKNLPAGESQDLLGAYVQKALERTMKESKSDTEDDGADQQIEESNHNLEGPNDGEETAMIQDGGDEEHLEPQTDRESADDQVEDVLRIKLRNRRAIAVTDSDSESEKPDAAPAGRDVAALKFGPSKLACMQATEECDENSALSTLSFSVVHRGSVSSLDELTEDRSDKENNQRLMFDRSEDKENKAVVRHGMCTPEVPPSPVPRSAHSEGIPNRAASGSPNSCQKEEDDVDLMKADQRSPLAVLSEDKPKVSQPEPSWTSVVGVPFGVSEAYFEVASSKQKGKLTAVDGIVEFGDTPLLQPAFADLFETGTEKPNNSSADKSSAGANGNSCCFNFAEATLQSQESRSNRRSTDGLGLTQDIALQPAFNVGDQVLRKAESIFGKEQVYLLEAANKKAQKKQIYVNDFGFLTQTRPSNEDIELYKSPLVPQKTARDGFGSSPTKDLQRRPLSTLSLSMPSSLQEEDLVDAPRRRLMKRRTPSSSPTRVPDCPTPAPRQTKNAFDVLALGQKNLAQYEKPKNRSEQFEFVEAEAEESDDDDILGFGLNKKGDDEEDDEDLDRTLETLVDDRDIDAETLAAQRVIEKFKEHVDQDDQEIEKLHQAAAQGELRRKRRNRGIGLDDSDEESDEDERNRKIRRKMNKRQKIGRDNIKALADNEETKSFYQVYEHDLVDDDNTELAYLQQDVVMDEPVEDNENDTREYVTREEIEDRVREVARKRRTEPTLNPHDVSWLDDNSDEEAGLNVKVVSTAEKKIGMKWSGRSDNHDDMFELKNSMMLEGEDEKKRLQVWAKIEGKRCARSARPGGGGAVTGHAKNNNAKSSRRIREGSSLNGSVPQRPSRGKPSKGIPSMLAGVCDRTAHFE